MKSIPRSLPFHVIGRSTACDEDPLDTAIVINEAVEIAKAYGTDESASFVNGVLGRIAREEQLPVDEDFNSALLPESNIEEIFDSEDSDE